MFSPIGLLQCLKNAYFQKYFAGQFLISDKVFPSLTTMGMKAPDLPERLIASVVSILERVLF